MPERKKIISNTGAVHVVMTLNEAHNLLDRHHPSRRPGAVATGCGSVFQIESDIGHEANCSPISPTIAVTCRRCRAFLNKSYMPGIRALPESQETLFKRKFFEVHALRGELQAIQIEILAESVTGRSLGNTAKLVRRAKEISDVLKEYY